MGPVEGDTYGGSEVGPVESGTDTSMSGRNRPQITNPHNQDSRQTIWERGREIQSLHLLTLPGVATVVPTVLVDPPMATSTGVPKWVVRVTRVTHPLTFPDPSSTREVVLDESRPLIVCGGTFYYTVRVNRFLTCPVGSSITQGVTTPQFHVVLFVVFHRLK